MVLISEPSIRLLSFDKIWVSRAIELRVIIAIKAVSVYVVAIYEVKKSNL